MARPPLNVARVIDSQCALNKSQVNSHLYFELSTCDRMLMQGVNKAVEMNEKTFFFESALLLV